MKIVDNGPQLWFLMQGDDGYYLSVRCQRSFSEFELLLHLNEDEYREYHALGHVYIDYLAARVSYWAPEYMARNESEQKRTTVDEAVAAWKAEHPGQYL